MVSALTIVTVMSFALPAQQEPAAVTVRVQIEGIGGALRANVQATLSLQALQHAGAAVSPARLRRLFERAPEEIAEALQPFGYYRPEIAGDLDESGSRWTASFTIAPGPPLTVTSTEIVVTGPGSRDSVIGQARESFPLTPGDTLQHSRYTAGKQALAAAARERGFLKASFDTAQIRIDRTSYRADVVLFLATGPQHYFGPVTLEQDLVNSQVLEGYLTIEEGAPYRQSEVERLRSDLAGTPYFSLVDVEAEEQQAADTVVPLRVTVSPRRSQQYGIGLGYGTDTGPRGSFNFEFRRLNKRGHHADGTIRYASIERSMSARYLIPALYPKVWLLALSTGFAQLRPDAYRSDKFVLGPEISRVQGPWRQALGLRYEHDDFVVGPDSGVSNLYLLTLSLGRIKADDHLFAERGTRIGLELVGSHQEVLSSVSLLRARVDAKAILPLVADVRLVARAEAGHLITSDFTKLPPTARFFTGGDQSVRGFEYLSLTPRDANGLPLGGRSLAVLSAELEWYLAGKWGLAVFTDAGNAFDDHPGSVEHGAGVGIRWRSPVGPIRVDGAWALSRVGSPFRVHFNIGPDF